jgi:hypothetical protein
MWLWPCGAVENVFWPLGPDPSVRVGSIRVQITGIFRDDLPIPPLYRALQALTTKITCLPYSSKIYAKGKEVPRIGMLSISISQDKAA